MKSVPSLTRNRSRSTTLGAASQPATPTIDEQTIIDAALSIGVVVTDNAGNIARWSRGATELLGYEPEQALGKPLCDWLEIPSRHGEQTKDAAAPSLGRVETWVACADGTRLLMQVDAHALPDDNALPDGRIWIMADRTGDRQAADTLRFDRDRLWQVSTDLMVTARFDGIILAANPAWSEILGWSEAQLIGTCLLDLVHPDDRPIAVTGLAELQMGCSRRNVNTRYRHHSGGYHWICWTSVPGDGVINAVGRDFTAEKAQAEALERSEVRLRSIFESSYQFQGLLDPDGTLLHTNPTSLAAIRSDAEAVVGRKFWDTPWFSETPGMAELVEKSIRTVAGGQSVRQEVTLQLPGGETIFDFSMRPVFDAHGVVTAIVPEAIDLSQRREAEARLRQAQKMEAVGQLTSGLAHDFNNLLTGIMGSLELLRMRLNKGSIDDSEHYISTALGAAGRAAALTHRLLAFSRRQTLDPKPTDANELVVDMEDLIRRTIGPAILLETILSEELWPTFCDPNQLENALLNLCINARDAMPDGGRLSIRTTNAAVAQRIASDRGMIAGEYISISVTDSGTGMTPDVLSRAFDPFFTTKPLGRGTGLGLSMIYGFIRQSGGHIHIDSDVGRGTSVMLYLPRHLGTEEQVLAATKPAAVPRATDGQTILLVDDEPTVRKLMVEALRELGYRIIEAEDGSSGLAVLLSHARIDLLVTDVGLPGGMNGRQLADAAQEMRPDLKVLFITGYAENALVANGQLEPGMHVLVKPFTLEALGSRIKAITGP